MLRSLRPLPRHIAGAGLASLLALATLGCTDPDPNGNVSGTALYVFDGSDSATSRLLVWDDTSKLDGATTVPSPTRNISGALLNSVKNLAIGGMAMDPWKNRLFLVDTAGNVVVVERVRAQNGSLSADLDIWTFKISDSTLGGGGTNVFGQACVDSSGSLYVTQCNDSKTGVCKIANAAGVTIRSTVTPVIIQNTLANDVRGKGVAVSGTALFGAFGGGAQVVKMDGSSYNGPRLRMTTSTAFPDISSVIIGKSCGMGEDGSSTSSQVLAYDNGAQYLYVAPNNDPAGGTPLKAVLIFKVGDFNNGFNVEPYMTLANVGQPLVMLAHPWSKDWLAGAANSGGAGSANPTFWLWKNPAGTTTEPKPTTITLSGTVQIRAIAFDGSNG